MKYGVDFKNHNICTQGFLEHLLLVQNIKKKYVKLYHYFLLALIIKSLIIKGLISEL